ncbi:MAG: YitT family protein [Lachnospiraceae bacterium]|nr:YitT family protein [Lachnospiraceae bacterium]
MTEKTRKFWRVVWKYALIALGTMIMAVAINTVFEPLKLVTGGVTGFAIVLKSWTEGLFENGIPIWFTNLAINLPLFALAWFFKGKEYVTKTLWATVLLSGWIYIIPEFAIFEDYFQGMFFGGVLSGIGIGLVLLAGSTTGGTDMIADLINIKIKWVSLPVILFVLDGAIVLCGALTFGLDKSIYAILVVYLVSKLSDAILDGLKTARAVYIISDKYDDISKEILLKMDRGVTSFAGTGMYTGKDKSILLCVVAKKQLPYIKDIIRNHDREAFVIITDAREVHGEGFVTGEVVPQPDKLVARVVGREQ